MLNRRDLMLIDEIFDIPDTALFNQYIPKNLIFEQANLKKVDKDLFTKYIKRITFLYQLNGDSLRLKPYLGDDRKYYEIGFINLSLKEENFKKLDDGGFKEDNKLNRIADIIFRSIPEPLVLSFEAENKINIFVSHIKDSLSDSEKITLDDVITTNWIDFSSLDEIDKILFDDLKLDNLNFNNVYSFYDDIISAILKYNGSKEVGMEVNAKSDEILEIMVQIEKIEKEIGKLKKKIKKECNFSEKLNINSQINGLNDEKSKLQEKLAN